MKKEVLAYFAGFFDGEGCVWINKYKDKKNSRNDNYILRVQMSNTNTTPLTEAKDLFGGGIYKNVEKRKDRRPCYSWRGSHLVAEEFLRNIFPFTVIKSKEIEVALAFRAIKVLEYQHGGIHLYKDKKSLEVFDSCMKYLQELKRKPKENPLMKEPDKVILEDGNF